ncbi:MAG: MBL fold metallo-hydrolase [Acidobacteria bacterium]|nr:MAG: MBL fold metallo-hydrolase [Acidobacteriota bacterium]
MAAVAAWLCVPWAAATMGRVAHVAVEGLVGSAVLVDWMPWLTRRLAPPPPLAVALYYASVLTLLALTPRSPAASIVRNAARPIAAVVFASCAFWIVAAPPGVSWARSRPLRVTFLDVGQGDSVIVQFPNGRTLSIDAGGAASSFDIGARVVSPAFWALGVRRLDYMTITHGDADHIGGASSLFRDFRPFEVWEGVPVPPHGPTRELRALADASGATWRTLQPLDRASVGAVDLLVHHPPKPDWERQRVRNDDSEVLEIRYGDVSFVFTGDVGREVERAIAPGFVRAPIRIVKVPHHGSATSSSPIFLDALGPDVAVIGAGRGNPFGHPVPAVLARYRAMGAAIYRTDLDGAVTVETDGTTVRVGTFLGRRLTLTTYGR